MRLWTLIVAGVFTHMLTQDATGWLVIMFAVIFSLIGGMAGIEENEAPAACPHCGKTEGDAPNADAVPSHQTADAVMT